jgi:hypothetical protein
VLPPVNFMFCSQWLTPLTNKIWKCNRLEVLLATLDKLWITKAWNWKCVPIEITHSDVGGCSDMKRTIHAFVRQDAWLVDVKITKKWPIMVSSICKDHLFGCSRQGGVYMNDYPSGTIHFIRSVSRG